MHSVWGEEQIQKATPAGHQSESKRNLLRARAALHKSVDAEQLAEGYEAELRTKPHVTTLFVNFQITLT